MDMKELQVVKEMKGIAELCQSQQPPQQVNKTSGKLQKQQKSGIKCLSFTIFKLLSIE